MSQPAYTPGPWSWGFDTEENAFPNALRIFHEKTRQPVCWRVHGGRANAALIAAAPELLEAAQEALKFVALNTPMVDSETPVFGPIADEADRIRDKLRNAILKAGS